MANQSEVAAHLDVSQQTVSKLKGAGILPAPGSRDGYDLDACRIAYIRHLRAGAAGRDSSRPGSLEAERARLAKEQADKVAMENAKARREMVDLAPLHDAMIQLVTRTRTQLERVPAIVAGSNHKLRGRIELAINDALEDLAVTRVINVSAEPIGEDDDTLQDDTPINPNLDRPASPRPAARARTARS